MRKTAAISVCALLFAGCKAPPAPVQQPVSKTDYSRFQLVSGTAYGLALDTKTGELCHTYNAHIDTYLPSRGLGSDMVVGHPSLDSIPLCIDLSQDEKSTIISLQMDNLGAVKDGNNGIPTK